MLLVPVPLDAVPTYSVRDRQILTQRIGELGTTEHQEIYGIISKRNIEHTRNKNGVFVNMTALPNDVVHTIYQFVAFCHDNKLVLDEYDKRLNECKFLCARHNDQQQQQQQQLQQPSSPKGHLPSIAESCSTQDQELTLPHATLHLPLQVSVSAAPLPLPLPVPLPVPVPVQHATIQLSAPSSTTSSSFKQAVKKFSRKRGCDSALDDGSNDAAFTDTLTPESFLIPDKSAAPCQLPPASPRS